MNLNERNLRAVISAVENNTQRLYDLHKRVDAMQASVSELVQRVSALEQQDRVRAMASRGRGPTVRE